MRGQVAGRGKDRGGRPAWGGAKMARGPCDMPCDEEPMSKQCHADQAGREAAGRGGPLRVQDKAGPVARTAAGLQDHVPRQQGRAEARQGGPS